MTGWTRPRPRTMRRAITIVVASVFLALTAYGPGNLASAFGFRQAPAPAPESIGYVPSSVPVRIEAPTARIYGLEKVVANQTLVLADGTTSVPTTYLRVNRIDLDDTTISHTTANRTFAITNPNNGDPATAAIAGNDAGSVVEMWLDVRGLDLCLTPDTLYSVVIGYAGVLGGRIDSLLATIAQIFGQFQGSTLAGFGPCIPLKSLLPILAPLIDAGVPLPAMLPAANLDVYAYTIKVTTDPGQPAVTAPLAHVAVTN